MQTTINKQPVDAEIIPEGDALTPREHWALEALDLSLRSNPAFTARYVNAKLVRVDSMRSLAETYPGRYYLRYSSDAGMTEFWGHVSRYARCDLKHGLVSIVTTPNAPVEATPPTLVGQA